MTGGMSRRRFLSTAGVAVLAGTEALTSPSIARTVRPRHRGQRGVLVLGGGVAGLTAAHELAERGYRVTVIERRELGGKARSVVVPRTGAGGRRPLPGEHSWRSFFGVYRNLPDTLRRIPLPGGRSVHDKLTATDAIVLAHSGGRDDLWIPSVSSPTRSVRTVDEAARELIAVLQTAGGLSASDATSLAQKFLIYSSSCDERRYGEWEHMSWWDYVQADKHSNEYRSFLNVLPRAVALRPKQTSARTVGSYFTGLFWSFFTDRGNDGAPDQVLTGPTSDMWITPWANHLRSLGVKFALHHTLEALAIRRGRIVSARVRDPHGHRHNLEADWFVCSLPVERARRLWTRAILAADPHLELMNQIATAGCNGMQFYLRREVPIAPGHYVCSDSPWALSSISQAQFWNGDFASTYGTGRQHDCLSVAISEFDQPGTLVPKPASQCTPQEFAREVWEQLKQYANKPGRTLLTDADLDSWFIDPGLHLPQAGHPVLTNDDQMFVNPVGGWFNRPSSTTAIPNLCLAADYVRTERDAATMEAANEAGRSAANAVLQASSSKAPAAEIRSQFQPPEFDALKQIDGDRYRRGEPNLFDQAVSIPHLPGTLRQLVEQVVLPVTG
jgi:uncharacterized protein with NAD-binding domain and iron-sulfur cluster